MADVRPDRCETCQFWDEFAFGEQDACGRGSCRRYPPLSPLMLTLAYRAVKPSEPLTLGAFTGHDDSNLLPWTGPDDWCGEWQGNGRVIAERSEVDELE